MHRIRLSGALALGLASCLAAGRYAQANVYAAHLEPAATSWQFAQNGALTLSYRLNEAASSATVEIFRAADPNTVVRAIAGGTAYGLNSVQWDGKDNSAQAVPDGIDYKFRVIVTDSVGHAAWTNITPLSGGNEIGSAQFRTAEGIAINRDPNSLNFGRVYVSSGESVLASANPGATAIGDGLFRLNSDMSFLGGDANTAKAPGNSALVGFTNLASNSSPWKIKINNDNPDEVVMTDFADGYENAWIFVGDGATAYRVLDASTTGPTKGAAYTHGNSICAALAGVGANRKLWVIDEDKDVGTVRLTFDLLRFDIGDTLVNYTAPASEVLNGGTAVTGATNFYTAREIEFGRVNGTSRIYTVNRRANNTAGNLSTVCYNINADGTITSAVWAKQNPDMSAAVGTGTSWIQTATLAVDEARNRMAVGRDTGSAPISQIAILKTDDGSFITAFDSSPGVTTAIIRSLAFDAAGNLFVSDVTAQKIRMWSPPDGPNTYTTPYAGFISVCAAPTPTINSQSGNVELCAGSPLDLTVSADGHGTDLRYEWKKAGSVVGTSATLHFDSLAVGDSGTYTVVVTGCGAAISNPITVQVDGPPVITQQPAALGLYAGETASFTVVATTVAPPSYQWKELIAGSYLDVPGSPNLPTLTLTNVPPAYNRKFAVVITDPTCGTSTQSSDVVLNVVAHPCSMRWADTDLDGDVDQVDFGVFQRCIGNLLDPNAPECRCLDRAEPAGVLNEADLSLFQACASGAMIPADPTCGKAVVFQDNFDDAVASATNWTVRTTPPASYLAAGTAPDATVTFAYDYGANGIPAAPYSTGTTKGLFVSVNDRNDDDPGTTGDDADLLEAALAFTNVAFTGDYTVQFDMWEQYDATGGSGTTEYSAMGVDADIPTGDLTRPVNVATAAGADTGPNPTGYLFTVDGEAGDTFRDYRTYGPGTSANELLGVSGGYAGGNQDCLTGIFPAIFPVPKSGFAGAPGNSKVTNGQWTGWGWVRVRIEQRSGFLSWIVNDNVVASGIAVTGPTTGSVMLGHMDNYASVNAKTTWTVFDNVVVTVP